ncbi:thermonuclease family protein [Roseiarcaceae bacterium H3SJ34-1]|uniref:thermonuclease family protein n=1 Tax=Terripilifer ovatus TaxID=3032367 RepID=UPI003AB94AC1|nr:thermonuclease family protein [Roseiarcaceae bacterium H3SJ34-1]
MIKQLLFALAVGMGLIHGAAAACGDSGGPGYRAPSGKCIGWEQLAQVCGSPPETKCTPELEAIGAQEIARAQTEARRARASNDRKVTPEASAMSLISQLVPLAANNSAEYIDPERIKVVDGDTIQLDGKSPSIRLVGFNAPETSGAKCDREQELGQMASRRLLELIEAEPVQLQIIACSCASGTEGTMSCNYGRKCGVLYSGGQDVGKTLIAERLAVPFICGKTRCPPTPKPWCSK